MKLSHYPHLSLLFSDPWPLTPWPTWESCTVLRAPRHLYDVGVPGRTHGGLEDVSVLAATGPSISPRPHATTLCIFMNMCIISMHIHKHTLHSRVHIHKHMYNTMHMLIINTYSRLAFIVMRTVIYSAKQCTNYYNTLMQCSLSYICMSIIIYTMMQFSVTWIFIYEYVLPKWEQILGFLRKDKPYALIESLLWHHI